MLLCYKQIWRWNNAGETCIFLFVRVLIFRGFVGSVLLLSSCNLLADEDARKRIEAVNPTMQVFKIKRSVLCTADIMSLWHLKFCDLFGRDNMRLCILSVMSHRIFQDPSQNTLRYTDHLEYLLCFKCLASL